MAIDIELIEDGAIDIYNNIQSADSYIQEISDSEKIMSSNYKESKDKLIEIIKNINTDDLISPIAISDLQLEIASLMAVLSPIMAKWDASTEKMKGYVNMKIGISFSEIQKLVKKLTNEKKISGNVSDAKVEKIVKKIAKDDVIIKSVTESLYKELAAIINIASKMLMVLHDRLLVLNGEAKGIY